MYNIKGEAPLEYSLLCAADGNMSLRGFKKVGMADDSKYESSYFVPKEEVDCFANVVQQQRQPTK